MKKLLVVMVLAAVVVALIVFDLHRLLSLEELRDSQARFLEWRHQSPVLVSAVFMAVYVLVTALSLPGAAVMTLAAGALFGLLWGTVLVSFASSIGATLAFVVARFLLRDWVQKRFGKRLRAINRGVEREGAFYLFALRLVPIFPFFVINLVMALTPMRTLTFYAVSQVGMLVGTIVYVNAGTQLAQVDSLEGILSFDLVASFALLGLFPLLAKKVLAAIKRRRVYSRWKRPKRYDRNLVVIGAGSAGLVSAYIAATVRAKVTLIEADEMGGDCLNTGCVPSKALIRTAKLAHQIRHADRYGLVSSEPEVSFVRVMNRVKEVIEAIEPHDSVERYTELGVEVIQGYARLVDPWTVKIDRDGRDSTTMTTRSIVLATGAAPIVPPIPGLDEVDYQTSETLWDALADFQEPPARVVIIGGGPIGCELAQCLARLGSSVSLVQRGEQILEREDRYVADMAMETLERDGVKVLTGHEAIGCEPGEHRSEGTLIVERDEAESRLAFDLLILAVGRKARLEGYGLEELGIPTRRTIETNDYLETLYPNIFAAGDVAGPYQFTHAAAHQAWYASVNALFGGLKKFRADYSVMPWTTFIDPEVARVGLNEKQATAEERDYEVTCYDIEDLDRAIADGSDYGMVKVLTEPGKDRILGATIVGKHAGDLLAELVLAMKHGIGLEKVLGTIHTYPTLAEANKYAAGEWKRTHAPERLLKLMERYHRWRRR